MSTLRILIFTALLVGLAACSGPIIAESTAPPGEGDAPALSTPAREIPLPTSPVPPPAGEKPLVFQRAQNALAEALDLPPEQVQLIAHEPVDWPDSCLGAPRPGEACAEVITPGYEAVFTAAGASYAVRLDKSGAQYRFDPQPSPGGASGIEGIVTLGPACPGPVSIESPCPDQPYQAVIAILDIQGEPILEFQSDQAGIFRQELPPGLYILHPQSPDALPYAEEVQVLVQAGQFSRIDIHYDSGLR
jgi:hypothetical protein